MNKPFAGVRVLVVEDNAVNQQVARGFLEAMGCVVSVANDGEEAVRAIKAASYDIIFMDCMMPKMDGLAATAEIRALEQTSGARNVIIALTASALAGERERCLAAGMDAYLTKPFSRAALQDAMSPFITKAETSTPVVVDEDGALDARAIESFRKGPGGAALLQQVVTAFEETAPREWQTIHSAFSDGDMATLRRAAHTLKSSCAWLGGTRVVDLLRDIERAAADGQVDVVASQLSDAEFAYTQFAHQLSLHVGTPSK